MKGGLGEMMKKAQEMQQNMQNAQKELANKEVTGESGGGLVVAAAVNDAVHKVEKSNAEVMQEMTSGLNLPPGFKLPF